jgi:predicted CoA-binding protein
MQSINEAAAAFLASKRVAVTGVSRTPKTHGSNNVYRRLRERGYQVFAVNPNTDQVEGDRCYRDLASIPGGVQAVVIGTRPEIAEDTMRECAELGIKHVWMHRGPGAGSVSATATGYGRQHHRMTVFGEVSQELRELFNKHAGGVRTYSFLQGLGTAVAV